LLANTHIRWELLRDSFPDRPETGPALSRVLLEQVARGERPPTVRLSRPGRVVAFGRRDAVADGYAEAVRAAAGRGFPGMERISGGRAAAFTEGALSLTLTLPDPAPAERTNQRFVEWTGLVRDSFVDLGVDARVGAVPREYCPGEYSINARGETKLAGVGQRMIRGAAHIGFVIIVFGADLVADVLEPVYAALGLEFDRATVGSLEDEVPGTTLEDVEAAILARLGRRVELAPVALDPDTRTLATERAPGYRSPAVPGLG